MALPRQIPRRLRRDAVVLEDFSEGEAAWSKADALAVISSLQGTSVLIKQAAVLLRAPGNAIVSEAVWTVPPSRHGGLTAEYAARSHAGAKDFVARYRDDGQEAQVALEFALRKDAA